MGDERGNHNNQLLPPGFRFFPTDEELVIHFLYSKAALLPCNPDIIPSLDLYRYNPWELNGKALAGGNQWYFFSRRTQNRVSADGYWKPIGADEFIASGNKNVGIKKCLAFYIGEAPDGVMTNWVMHEYHLLDYYGGSSNASTSSSSNRRRSFKRRSGHQQKIDSNMWVLCRVHEANCGGSQTGFCDDGMELSCLDEVFLSFDDLDEINQYQ